VNIFFRLTEIFEKRTYSTVQGRIWKKCERQNMQLVNGL